MSKYYKFLKADGSATYSKGKWALPDGDQPGEWMPEIEGEIVLCESGYHATTAAHLVEWTNARMFEVEYDGDVIVGKNKVVGRRARLMREIAAWNDKTARMFAADCAERVLPLFEKRQSNDDRPRKAIQAARDFANGKINASEMDAARAAAWAAAWAAARAAAWAAARAAAWDAARDAQAAYLRKLTPNFSK